MFKKTWREYRRRVSNLFLLAETLIWLFLIKLVLSIFSFKRIAPWLGEHMLESQEIFTVDQNRSIPIQIKFAILRVTSRVPWSSKCFDQAIAAKMMLRRRHFTSTLYLGVRKSSDIKLEAHAWLRCGDLIVTGEMAQNNFTLVSSFAERAQ